MKKHLKPLIILIAMCIMFVISISGCTNPSKQNERDVLLHTTISRLDKQNDVYYHLAQQIEEYLSGDRVIEEAKFSSFCMGVNCFIRDEQKNDWYELYENDEDVIEVIKDLMGSTAINEMEMLILSELSDDVLKQLVEDFYYLADCCDRTIENSFAYYVETQNFEDDLFQAELDQVKKTLENISEMTGTKGEHIL